MANESRLSMVIDDDGRLFGVVNVIDALVILLVAAVLIAGAVFIFGIGDETDTRYVTVDLGPQPEYTAQQITAGDEWGSDFTVTDVYMSPAGANDDGDVNVLIKAAVNGTVIDQEATAPAPISFTGEPLRFGRLLEIETNEWAAEGTVIDIEETGPDIDTTTEQLVLQADVDAETARAISPGDEYRVGETNLLTIESVTVYRTGDTNERTVVIGASAQTRFDRGTQLLGDQTITVGSSLSVETRSYAFDGRIINTGSLEEPGSPTTVSATIDLGVMSEERANRLAVGMTETTGGVVTAEIVDIEDQPYEEVVLTGSGYETFEHPTDREVTITIEISTRELDDGTLRFRGHTIEVGDDISLRFAGIPVDGEVQSLA